MKALPRYAVLSWYALLVLWMQGIAVMNIALAVCLLASMRFLPAAIERLRQEPFVWKTLLTWEILRLISSALAQYPSVAFIGMLDDLRGIMFGLMALIFLRTREDLIMAAKLTGIGLFIVSVWTLGQQLLVNPSLHAGLFETGTLSLVNAAAVYTSIAIIVLAVLIPQLQSRRSLMLIPLLLPLLILQIPYSSRSTLLISILALGLAVYLTANRKMMLRAAVIGGVAILFLSGTQVAKNAIQTVSNVAESGDLEASPSLQVRWEIFQLLAHLSLQHPFGLGPRNHGLVDLNEERDFLREHFAFSAKYLYGLDVHDPAFETFDFNHPKGQSRPVSNDPHSQYAATLAETGPLGLILLGAIYLMLLRLAWPLARNAKDLVHRFYGVAGVITVMMFVMGGLNVIVLSKAGTLLVYGLTAAMISCRVPIGLTRKPVLNPGDT